ncbi:MAG: virulence-associated protein E [Lachnospiraceae bacterium]|nr:virulence-associated protein E [Lachnospiraceae bacterium]
MGDELHEAVDKGLKGEISTVEEVRSNLQETGSGQVKQTIGNVVYALGHDPLLAGALRKNELTGRVDIVKSMPWKRMSPPMNETDGNQIRLYLEHNYQLTSERCISIGLSVSAGNNSFHPIRDRLEALVWDGEERIGRALHHFLGAEENEYTAEVMKMHMLAAISRIYFPGCKYDIALCLVGPQGGGKSTFFRFLAIEDEWFTDDLRRLEDKRVFEKMNGHWIIELSEMSAIAGARSIEETKAFISRQRETYRMPYEKYAEDRPRQCVFCGTTNDIKFLPFDRSGNRRFAPVAVRPDLAETHPMEHEEAARAYIVQMWAEAMVLFRTVKFSLTFTKEMETYAREMQREFMPEDTEIGQIEEFLEEKHITRTCIREIFCEIYNHSPSDDIPTWMSKKIAEALRCIGWDDCAGSRKFKRYGSQKAWEPIMKGYDEPGKKKNGFKEVPDDITLPF